MAGIGSLGLVSRKAGYIANGVYFGSGNWIQKTSALSGVSDSKLFTWADWVFLDSGASGDNLFKLEEEPIGDTPTLTINFRGTNEIQCVGTNAGGAPVLNFQSTSVITTNTWHHIAISVDMASGVEIYIDGVSDTPVVTTLTDVALTLTQPNITVGASGAGGAPLIGSMADFYFNAGTATSLASNINKFITTEGKPTNMGDDGTATGLPAPTIYLSKRISESASDFATNKGSGGGFTQNGTLTDSSTSPSS